MTRNRTRGILLATLTAVLWGTVPIGGKLALPGMSLETAAAILPVIGVIDFTVAALALTKPIRIVLLYAALWGLLTGLARPLAGTEIWAFVERWPNWGVPLALFYLRGWPRKRSDWLR